MDLIYVYVKRKKKKTIVIFFLETNNNEREFGRLDERGRVVHKYRNIEALNTSSLRQLVSCSSFDSNPGNNNDDARFFITFIF